MSKRISVSVSDKMFAKLTELKDEMVDGEYLGRKFSRKISKVCQKALNEILVEAEVSRSYRIEGMKDGEKAASSLSAVDQNFIVKVLNGEGPYKKWSRFEKVSTIHEHFYFPSNAPYDFLIPRFKDLMNCKIVLDAWVVSDPDKAEDRVGEMCWSYIEGFYEGIAKEITK